MKPFSLPAVLAALILALAAFAAGAKERVALVIGNSDYLHQAPLANPANDANRMAETLRAIGYEVSQHFNLTERELMRTLSDFADVADRAEVALVYYSGHGMEIGGRNYIIPVDAELKRERDAQFEAVDLAKVRTAIAGAAKLKVVILDACRNNTFLPSTRGGTRGLGRITAEAGEIIAYSTAPGSVAQDGPPGELSPYTRALAEKLEESPELDVRFLFTSLGRLTEQYAGVQQRPYTEFAAILPEGALPLGRAGPPPADEAYRVALAGDDPEALRRAVADYPDHADRAAAEARLAALEADRAVSAALASQDRAALEAALERAPDHAERPALLAALALHAQIDEALGSGALDALDGAWRAAGEAHPRRAALEAALPEAVFAEACAKLEGYSLDCPVTPAALSEGAAPVVAAAAPAAPPPPVDPLADWLADVDEASLGKAEEIAMEWRQTALAALGHYRGAIDGAKGPGTAGAISAWQTATGVGATGDLTAREIVALMKQAAPRRAETQAYLGVMYGLGVGVKKDPEASRRLLEGAAEGGFADARAYLRSVSNTW